MQIKKWKVGVVFALGLIFLFCIWGCSPDASQNNGVAKDSGQYHQGATRIITDCAGREVEVPTNVQKVAELHPMAAYSLMRLAKAEKFVVTDTVFSQGLSSATGPHDTDAQRATLDALPVTAPFFKGADEELLLSLKPDIVFTLSSDQNADRLQDDLGIPVVCVAKAPSDKAAESFCVVGQAVGNEQVGNDMSTWWTTLSKRIKDDGAKRADADKPRVMYVGKSGNIMAVPGKDTVFGTVIRDAGYKSVSDDLDETSNESIAVTMEQMMNWDPDAIVCQTTDEKETILSDLSWGALRAVKEGKVFVSLEYASFDGWFSLLGSDWLNTTLIHNNEASAKAQLVQDMKDFYKLFYEQDITDDELSAVVKSK